MALECFGEVQSLSGISIIATLLKELVHIFTQYH